MEMLETLLHGVRSACAAFPDMRRGEVTYCMADIGLSAFSLFFMQSGSFLAHQRALQDGRKMSNCQSLFGMTAVPRGCRGIARDARRGCFRAMHCERRAPAFPPFRLDFG